MQIKGLVNATISPAFSQPLPMVSHIILENLIRTFFLCRSAWRCRWWNRFIPSDSCQGSAEAMAGALEMVSSSLLRWLNAGGGHAGEQAWGQGEEQAWGQGGEQGGGQGKREAGGQAEGQAGGGQTGQGEVPVG